mmetsp:Transcript_19444/g.39743  ORF Transcript_19444/g.39743 Transcript_19444/m.39743 type:complete len:103 (+) Transcript_19444:409-717(+)
MAVSRAEEGHVETIGAITRASRSALATARRTRYRSGMRPSALYAKQSAQHCSQRRHYNIPLRPPVEGKTAGTKERLSHGSGTAVMLAAGHLRATPTVSSPGA